MNRIDRLLGYLLIFQRHDLVRAQDLAARFEVSERTVYRDIEALYEVGVPLVGMPGEGYQLMPGYYLPPIMFGEDEAKVLFLAIAMLTGLTVPGTTHRAAQNALDKIRVILPKAIVTEVEALQAILGFYHIGRSPLNLDDPKFIQIQQAIRERRAVVLEYHAQHDNQITERTVEPLQLAYLDNVWVLSAYCRLRADQRAFRLDRINHFRLTRERFAPRAVRDRRDRPGKDVIIQVDDHAIRWVQESQHFAFIRESVAASGKRLMHYHLHDLEKFTSWLLQWGEDVEAVAPKALRMAMMRRVDEMASRYRVWEESNNRQQAASIDSQE